MRERKLNTDIRVNTSVLTHKKIRKLILRKGHEGFYNLISLWMDAAIHRPKGKFTGYDKTDLMMAMNTSDEKLIDLLVEIRLLDLENNVYAIHNWNKNNHWVCGAESRSESAKNAAEIRWKKGQNSKITKSENRAKKQ